MRSSTAEAARIFCVRADGLHRDCVTHGALVSYEVDASGYHLQRLRDTALRMRDEADAFLRKIDATRGS